MRWGATPREGGGYPQGCAHGKRFGRSPHFGVGLPPSAASGAKSALQRALEKDPCAVADAGLFRVSKDIQFAHRAEVGTVANVRTADRRPGFGMTGHPVHQCVQCVELTGGQCGQGACADGIRLVRD